MLFFWVRLSFSSCSLLWLRTRTLMWIRPAGSPNTVHEGAAALCCS